MAKKAATKSAPETTKVAPRRGDMKFFTDHDHQAAADLAYGAQKSGCQTLSKSGAKSQKDGSFSGDWTPETD